MTRESCMPITSRSCRRAPRYRLARLGRPRRRLLLMLILASACAKEAREEVETAAVVPVTVSPAETGDIVAVIHATGTVEPAPGADLRITAPESARIVEIAKAEGDRVRRGDLLVRFEIPSLGAESAAKRAEVERAQARLTNATAARTRAPRPVRPRRRGAQGGRGHRPRAGRRRGRAARSAGGPHRVGDARLARRGPRHLRRRRRPAVPQPRRRRGRLRPPSRCCASSIRAGSKSWRPCRSPTSRTSRLVPRPASSRPVTTSRRRSK